MKVGQQVALFADTLDLPPEVGQMMSRLNSQAEAVPFDVIRQEIERELERPLSELFTWFDKNPLGTASLAQAHAARLPDGRDVVVKVLHRGVSQSVDTDLLALKGVLLSSRVIRRPKEEIDEIFDEIKERLHEELDYLQEAANLAAYRRIYANDPGLRIPAVHTSLSSERVLTMDRVQGLPIDTFVEMATPEARFKAGSRLARFYYEQVFKHRMLHADPHPGNYLFQPDGTVGVLDFGCIKRFDPFWIGTYARVALAMLDEDREAGLRSCIDLGAWDGVSPESGEVLWQFVCGVGKGFRMGELTLGGADERLLDELRPVVEEMIRHPSIRAPRHVIMLHRSLGGLYAINRKLQLKMDFGALLREHATHAVAVAEGRIQA